MKESERNEAETQVALKTLEKHHILRGAVHFIENGGTCLNMNGFQLGDQGGLYLAGAIIQSDSLLELHMRNCGIGDSGAIRLAEAIEKNTTLRTFSLSGNEFTEAGVQRLEEARQKSKLRSLDLANNPGTGGIGAGVFDGSCEGSRPSQRLGVHTVGGLTTISVGVAMIPDLGEHVPAVTMEPDETENDEQVHTDGAMVEEPSPNVNEVDKGEEGVDQEPIIPKIPLSENKDESDDDDSDSGIDLGFLNDATVQQSIRSARGGTA